jgi:predicted nucleic acid-binding protein
VGNGKVNAVSNSGPLIHLNEINCIEFLSIFDNLHIPDAVWSETIGKERISQTDILKLKNIERYTLPESEVKQFILKNNLEELHSGEQECLYLCHHISVKTILTDDMAVRKVAKDLNLTAVGSLGIVVRAYRTGIISLTEAESNIVALYEVSSLFVTKAIVELSIEELHKYVK